MFIKMWIRKELFLSEWSLVWKWNIIGIIFLLFLSHRLPYLFRFLIFLFFCPPFLPTFLLFCFPSIQRFLEIWPWLKILLFFVVFSRRLNCILTRVSFCWNWFPSSLFVFPLRILPVKDIGFQHRIPLVITRAPMALFLQTICFPSANNVVPQIMWLIINKIGVLANMFCGQ